MQPAVLLRSPEINLTNSVLSHKERLEKDLISWLDEFVVGQDEAKRALVRVIIEWLFNVYRDQWVLWAVFLAWPTGVGKTELARSLSRTLLWDPSAITKIVAETMPHPADIAQLIGSSAGYIGYGDTPEMADTRIHRWYKDAKEKGRLHPLLQWYEATDFSIVLVDEVEKAHPDIPNAFLWAIQSGEMKMASGKESDGKMKHSKITDLRNTLFIFTSNTGEHKLAESKGRSIGFTIGGGQRWLRQRYIYKGTQKNIRSWVYRTNGCGRPLSLSFWCWTQKGFWLAYNTDEYALSWQAIFCISTCTSNTRLCRFCHYRFTRYRIRSKSNYASYQRDVSIDRTCYPVWKNPQRCQWSLRIWYG